MRAVLQTNTETGTWACSSHTQGCTHTHTFVAGDDSADTKTQAATGRRLLWVALRAAPKAVGDHVAGSAPTQVRSRGCGEQGFGWRWLMQTMVLVRSEC